jgi:hypothetical protein
MPVCFGCRVDVKKAKNYPDDTTPWCSDCFVTPKQLEDVKKRMPLWQGLLSPKPSKIRFVVKLPTPPSPHPSPHS